MTTEVYPVLIFPSSLAEAVTTPQNGETESLALLCLTPQNGKDEFFRSRDYGAKWQNVILKEFSE